MELDSDPTKEDVSITFYYTQPVYNSKELCIICQLDETDEGKQWDRYKIICGHMFHTRCYRRWIFKKKCLNCPYCGDIPQIVANEPCHMCHKFGHDPRSCPILKIMYD